MKPTLAIKHRLVMQAERDKPDMFGRITAILALLAWLVLASDALAQGANQWAPEGGLQVPVAPMSGQVWSVDQGAASLYAPVDLDQQLASGSVRAPVAPAAQGTPSQAPVYAPAGTATSRLAPPGAPVAVAPPTYPAYPGAGAAPVPAIPGQPYGYGAPMVPQPFVQPYPQPFAQPYGQPVYGYPYSYPYSGAISPGLYPGVGSGPGAWGGPFGSPGAYGTLPFFGASPFGFW